jgi:hypothetical protein
MLLQNEGISISANKPIELFKEGSDGLGNLSVSSRSKSRNGERVICEHRRSKHKNPPYSLSIAPTTPQIFCPNELRIIDGNMHVQSS